MKNSSFIIAVLLLASGIISVLLYTNGQGCRTQKESFELGREDSLFIDRTVEIYDSFVRSRMGDELPIGEAYLRFFAETGAKVKDAGDVAFFMPDSTYVYGWTNDLIRGRLLNSLIELSYAQSEPVDPTPRLRWPSGWRFRLNLPKFEKFGNQIAKTNDSWREMTESIVAAGDFSPTYRASIIHAGKEINYDNKMERFLTAIAFMDGCFNHRDFNLVKDVARNDSLKIAWETEFRRSKNDTE